MRAPAPAEVRFWEKVAQEGDCWIWQAGVCSGGYGQFRVSTNRKTVAHRFAYEQMIGPVPEGLQLDHLCRTRRCVNPYHLEPVTGRINTLRSNGPTAQHARKTHCSQGHEYTDENTRIDKRGGRNCRTCHGWRGYAAEIGGGR